MAEGDRIPPQGDVTDAPPAVPQPKRGGQNPLKRASEFLLESSRIGGLRTHYDKYRRYVTLESNEIFNALVSLYAGIFLMQGQHLKRFMDHFPSPGISPSVYAARIYISGWFHDLYVSNREAVRKLSSLAFNEHYLYEMVKMSDTYDNYLSMLNASIRPTHIKLALEDALYLPLITDDLDVENIETNPFRIVNYTVNEDLFYGLVDILKLRKEWVMTPLSHDTLGRPCWLFDWHTQNRVCAWFHMEGNFNMDDVTLAYILGVACTPKLAPRDVDDWQYYPQGVVPHHPNPDNYERVIPRRFYGSYEVRVIETKAPSPQDAATKKTQAKGKGKAKAKTKAAATALTIQEPSEAGAEAEHSETEVQAVNPEFRLIDWTYYYLVVLKMESHTRTGAHRIISFTN